MRAQYRLTREIFDCAVASDNQNMCMYDFRLIMHPQTCVITPKTHAFPQTIVLPYGAV